MRFVYRHFAFLGPESSWAAEAAECAGEQGKFWEYHDTLFQSWGGENRGAFAKVNLKAFAARLRLDTLQFAACLDGERYGSRVRQETQAASGLNVRATPTIFVNGQKIEGLADYATYRFVIDEAIRKAR